jgi:hypothetical protein
MGARNLVGNKCGIESHIAHGTSVLEAEIDFSSSTCSTQFLLGSSEELSMHSSPHPTSFLDRLEKGGGG